VVGLVLPGRPTESEHLGEQSPLAFLDRVFAAGPLDVGGADVPAPESRKSLRGYAWLTLCPQEIGDRLGGVGALWAGGAFVAVEALRKGGYRLFVLDSDCADVQGLTPSGVNWRAYLHPETAEGYGAPALDQSDEEITRQALAWSAEAGLAADTGALRDAFEATNEFAEDTLDELLGALGIPGP
jgi:hypothetical protein